MELQSDNRFVRMKEIVSIDKELYTPELAKEFLKLYDQIINSDKYQFDEIEYLKGKVKGDINLVSRYKKVHVPVLRREFYSAVKNGIDKIEKYYLGLNQSKNE